MKLASLHGYLRVAAVASIPASAVWYFLYKKNKDENKKIKHYNRCITDKVFMDFAIGSKYAGRVLIGLYGNEVPMTCENFLQLCQGYKVGDKIIGYRNNLVYKIFRGVGIATGDVITGQGTHGLSIYGPRFPDENFNMDFVQDGDVAMTCFGPNMNSSHFIITLCPLKPAYGKHVVFGTVLKGMKVVRAIEKVGTKGGRPLKAVRIINCGLYREDEHGPQALPSEEELEQLQRELDALQKINDKYGGEAEAVPEAQEVPTAVLSAATKSSSLVDSLASLAVPDVNEPGTKPAEIPSRPPMKAPPMLEVPEDFDPDAKEKEVNPPPKTFDFYYSMKKSPAGTGASATLAKSKPGEVDTSKQTIYNKKLINTVLKDNDGGVLSEEEFRTMTVEQQQAAIKELRQPVQSSVAVGPSNAAQLYKPSLDSLPEKYRRSSNVHPLPEPEEYDDMRRKSLLRDIGMISKTKEKPQEGGPKPGDRD